MPKTKPFIKATEIINGGMEVTIQAETLSEATAYAKNYYGDSSTDIRNCNTVIRLRSNGTDHTYLVTWRRR